MIDPRSLETKLSCTCKGPSTVLAVFCRLTALSQERVTDISIEFKRILDGVIFGLARDLISPAFGQKPESLKSSRVSLILVRQSPYE